MESQKADELLRSALRRAEASDAPVRAAALLRVARVLTKFDQAEAEGLMERGLAIFADLPDEDRAAMAPQVVSLVGCVAPDRAFALRATLTDPFARDKFLYDMVAHGHAAAAADYLTRWSEQGGFPYDEALSVLPAVKDEEKHRGVLLSAVRAWRGTDDRDWRSTRSLVGLFRYHWRALPDTVARDLIGEIVRTAGKRSDQRLNSGVGGPRGKVTFSSQRPSLLFELLGPLKSLAPELAQDAIRENPELARAAELYPAGLDDVSDRPTPPPSAEALREWERDWTGFQISSGRFFRMEDEKASDFRSSFEYALRTLARDTGSNKAPAECWPSAEDFRSILYAAGRYEGSSGARLLDRIPDPILRLFAQIEFAAGMAGLPQIGGITHEQLLHA